MAKLTYLQLINRVLKRDGKSQISDVTLATGQAAIISELINEVQNVLFGEADWCSLYATRTFATVASTAEYSLASDFGRGIDMINVTSNWVMLEEFMRQLDLNDPDADTLGPPRFFTIQGDNYRLYNIPDGVYTIRERYWKVPTTLSANTDTSDLPIECENCIIYYTLGNIKVNSNNSFQTSTHFQNYARNLKRAMAQNDRKINKLNVIRPHTVSAFPITPPQFPPQYGRTRFL